MGFLFAHLSPPAVAASSSHPRRRPPEAVDNQSHPTPAGGYAPPPRISTRGQRSAMRLSWMRRR
jgi:hypothetical protein